MSFILDTEHNNKIFLDVNVIPKQGKFMPNIYLEPTSSGVYTHFHSFLHNAYKNIMKQLLLKRCFWGML